MRFLGSLLFILTAFGGICQECTDYQLLWEVTGKKLKKPSYVFGSMHSNDPRLFQFPDSLYTAFVKADAVVLETDITSLFDSYDVRLDLFDLDFLANKNTYSASREATRTAYGSEDGYPQFLDAYFQQTGYCGGKKFFALETVDAQLEATADLNEMSAKAAVRNIFFSRETFVQYYLQGDIATLSRMLRSQLQDMPGAYETLISDRNTIMANGLDTLMRRQSVFCAIGSGHLYGNDGVLQLLRGKGFQVRPVVATYTGEVSAAEKTMRSWRKYSVKNESFGFQIDLGGKPLETISDDEYRFIYQELGQGNSYELIVSNYEMDLLEVEASMVNNKVYQPRYVTLEDGTRAVEGAYMHELKGLQWQRVFSKNGKTYELICYGGNKFLHSDRPQRYFSRLKLL
jgi:uncharacterized protein YbaP (TraB family)